MKSVGCRDGWPIVLGRLDSVVGIGDFGHTIKDIIVVVEEMVVSRFLVIWDGHLGDFVVGAINHITHHIIAAPLESAGLGSDQLLLSVEIIEGFGSGRTSCLDNKLGVGGASRGRGTVLERHSRGGTIRRGRTEGLLDTHAEVIVLNRDRSRRRNR